MHQFARMLAYILSESFVVVLRACILHRLYLQLQASFSQSECHNSHPDLHSTVFCITFQVLIDCSTNSHTFGSEIILSKLFSNGLALELFSGVFYFAHAFNSSCAVCRASPL